MRYGIMLCYPLEEKRLLKWGPPYIVQPKLDGDRCRCIIDDEGEVELISSEGHPRNQSVPHIANAIKQMVKDGTLQPDMELDGELYIHEGGYHELIHGIVSRTVNLHPDYKKAQYHIFDIINDSPNIIRVSHLQSISRLFNNPYINIVRTFLEPDIEAVYSGIEEFIKENYEGIIVRRPSGMYERKRSTNIMKFKPRKEDTYTIIGTEEEISIDGMPKNSLGALVLMSGDREEAFKVGTGSYLTRERRVELWKVREALVGKSATIMYQRMSAGRKVPVFPVLINVE
uniref:Polydeoxyribonucleotide synthase [ATP] n=1 Tax=viral metagenome TaxID=1070528 RepID=A0A6M3L571_9ZZZZ